MTPLFITAPMLAPATCIDLTTFNNYPILTSPKIDGIRALRIGNELLSRKFKWIPNNHIRNTLLILNLPEGLDGELLTYTNGQLDSYNTVQSKVMSKLGSPEFKYHVFDIVTRAGGCRQPYAIRYHNLLTWYSNLEDSPIRGFVTPLWQEEMTCREAVEEYEAAMVEQGFEGIMLRNGTAPYKCGRCTPKQDWLLKLVRWTTSEATIIGFEEQMLNTNELEENELGNARRSKAAAGMIGKETLGVLLCRDIKTGQEMRVGTGLGLDDTLRQTIWRQQWVFHGQTIKYKHKPFGAKDAPRQAIFVGFRDTTID